ncbi:hypothetical protein [Snodgrassella gandavensis]|uniref:hypothetical protein n=1 Tax=Snodgrassella gandavensis TaxID=2946698 RepID=UPI001EF68A3B|nr:hypothetical protein [Snodgrassella gandavensis]
MAAPQGIRPLFDKAWAASEIIYNKVDNLNSEYHLYQSKQYLGEIRNSSISIELTI